MTFYFIFTQVSEKQNIAKRFPLGNALYIIKNIIPRLLIWPNFAADLRYNHA